jgi:molybdopterin-guanine dinucleotide biosynthesis protein
MRPTIVSISGFASDAGKTTVVCRLLQSAPGWEAIKVSRGDYESCRNDPKVCCASEDPERHAHILSDPNATKVPGKDTGRYWEAGASAVQWLIASDGQIEAGIRTALGRVRAQGVFIEGGSFLKYIAPDYSLMVAAMGADDIKQSSVQLLARMDGLLLTDVGAEPAAASRFREMLVRRGVHLELPLYLESDLPLIGAAVQQVHAERSRSIR